jgi:hypothetical protein
MTLRLWISPTRVTCAFAWPDLLIVPRSINGLGPPLLLVINCRFQNKATQNSTLTFQSIPLIHHHHHSYYYLPLNTIPLSAIPRLATIYSTTHSSFKLTNTPKSPITAMATVIAAQLARPSIRHFSAHRPRPDSRAARAVAMSCIVSGVVLPFVPPALESSRQRNSNSPDSTK